MAACQAKDATPRATCVEGRRERASLHEILLVCNRVLHAGFAMIVALCGASLALQPGTQPLLLLRGGAQPAVVQAPAMDPAAMDPAPKVRLTEVRNKARPRRSKKKQKGPGAFGLRDGAAALVGVAAVGATFVSTDRIMMSLPRELHSVGWTALGGVLLRRC